MYLSGRGGTRSLELRSGHAPGKDGVGETTTMRERERRGAAQLLGQIAKQNDIVPSKEL